MADSEPSTQVLDSRRLRRRGDRILTPTFTMIEGPGIGVLHVLDTSRRAHRMGRGDSADIQIQAPSVSRFHAVAILATNEGEREVRIEDNGSTNGIQVNGAPVREAWLASGDKVRLGDVLLRFQWMTEDEIQYASGVSSRILNAAKDPLTGLLTRAFVQDRLPSRLHEAERRGQSVCCSMLDLDHFKRINDLHGHLVGDAVILRASAAIAGSMRASDIAVRYGGEEFLVILQDTGMSEAVEAAQRFRQAIASIDFADLVPRLVVTASQGLALRARGETVESWIERADRALYAAKGEGRDRVRIAPGLVLGDDEEDAETGEPDRTGATAPVEAPETLDADGDPEQS
jgi:two-component system cell cycle response regulator